MDKQTLFIDKSVFNSGFIPASIFVRDEFSNIYEFYYDCLKYQLQQQLILLGPSGVGKTMASKYYGSLAIRYAKENNIDFSVIYINCRDVSSPYLFWQTVLSNLDHKAPKGLGITDLLDKFAHTIKDQYHVVIILDELEKLLTALGDKGNDIMYTLIRIKSNRDMKAAISLILISNNAHLEQMFDGPISSSMNTKRVVFGRYSADEIYQILLERASLGLKAGAFLPAIVKLISAYTVNHFSGDARAGIRLLFNSALSAQEQERKRILEKDVKKSIDMTKKEAEADVIDRLSLNQLFTLKAIVEASKNSKEKFLKVNTIYKKVYRPRGY